MRAWLFTLTAFALSGCSYSISKTNGDMIPASGQGMLSFATVNRYILQPKCVSCHGTQGGVRLENYGDFLTNRNAIEKTVFQTGTMPKAPVSALSQTQLKLLRDWLDAGAPEIGSGAQMPQPEEPPLEPTFISIKTRIFEAKCFVCHSVGSDDMEAADIPLDTVGALSEWIVPGNPSQSKLVKMMLPTAKKRMPPRKSNIAPLTEEELSVVSRWIELGANP